MPEKIHYVRCWPEPFEAQWTGIKQFEIRENDRDYAIGDSLILQEYVPHTGEYTGRELRRTITYITQFAQRDDHVVLGTTARITGGLKC